MYKTPETLVAPPGEPNNYYEVLLNSLEKLDESTDDKLLHELPHSYRTEYLKQIYEEQDHIKETLKFIDREIEDEDARKARSRVLAILDHEPDHTKRQLIWNNVVQAWNCSVQKTLCAEGGSVGVLPGAVSPGLRLQTPTDVLVPVYNKPTVPMASVADPPTLPNDIDEITWKMIAKVRKETAGTMEQLTRARNTGNIKHVVQPLREHLDAVARILPPPNKVSTTIPYVLMGASIVVGSVPVTLAVFGDPALVPVVAMSAYGVSLMTQIGSAICTSPRRQRRALTNTLERAVMGQPK